MNETLWDHLWELTRSTADNRRTLCPPLDGELWRRTEKTHYLLHSTNLSLGDLWEVVRQLADIVDQQAKRIKELEEQINAQ